MAAIDPIVEYSQRLGLEFGLKAAIHEYKSWMEDEKVILTKSEAERKFSPDVIEMLVKRGLLQDYQFGIEEIVDSDGTVVKKPKGRIYFKRVDILVAMEKGNLLRGTAELRAETYRMKEINDKSRKKKITL